MENYKIHGDEPALAEMEKEAMAHGFKLRMICEGEYIAPGVASNRINIPVVDLDPSTMTGKIGKNFSIG